MAVTFRPDADLSVLAICSHTDLERLARILTWDEKQGKSRPYQQLLEDPVYVQAGKNLDLRPAWRSIGAELQAQGGSGAMNLVRGSLRHQQGVPYREVVQDLCEHFEVKSDGSEDIRSAEDKLLRAVLVRQQNSTDKTRFAEAVKEASAGLRETEEFPGSWDSSLVELKDHRSGYVAVQLAQALGFPSKPAEVNLDIPIKVGRFLPSVLAGPAAFVSAAAVVTASAASSAMTQITEVGILATYSAVLEVIRIRRKVLLYPLSAGDMQ
jgi:hypothetical protein